MRLERVLNMLKSSQQPVRLTAKLVTEHYTPVDPVERGGGGGGL